MSLINLTCYRLRVPLSCCGYFLGSLNLSINLVALAIFQESSYVACLALWHFHSVKNKIFGMRTSDKCHLCDSEEH